MKDMWPLATMTDTRGRLGGVWNEMSGLRGLFCLPPGLLLDDTPVATAKNMPGDSADLFGDGTAEDGSAANGRLWRTVIIGEQEHRIDLHMIRPYMKVVTHGGERTSCSSSHSAQGTLGNWGSVSAPLWTSVSSSDPHGC